MDALTLIALLVGAALMTVLGVIAWQFDRDTTHPDNRK